MGVWSDALSAPRGQAVGGLRRQQQMVDADAQIVLPGATLIVPEGISAHLGMDLPIGIGEAEVNECAEGLAALRPEQGVALPSLGVVAVLDLRDHVVVTAQQQDPFLTQQRLRMAGQPLHPRELVAELTAGDGVAVGQIDRGGDQSMGLHLKIAGLAVRLVARQRPFAHRDGFGREDGHAIVALLPHRLVMVAQGPDLQRREALLLALEFLQQ